MKSALLGNKPGQRPYAFGSTHVGLSLVQREPEEQGLLPRTELSVGFTVTH